MNNNVTFFYLILYVSLYAIFNVAGIALIKQNIDLNSLKSLQGYVKFLFKPIIILAFIFIFISLFFALNAIANFPITLVYPLAVSINFLITILVGTFFLNENFDFVSFIGVIVILAGIAILTFK